MKDDVHGRACGFCDMKGVDTVPTSQVRPLWGHYSALH